MSGAAYEVVSGVSADEAEALGLIVVEWVLHGSRSAPVFGRYLDAAPPASAADAVEGPDTVAAAPSGDDPAPKRPRGRPRKD